ncbi:hypothetical protein [Microvirga sp. TS319]|uniref:hypothetical protein n=1 Tax=Microvirga sp. TS319 TaxID=3241165 RepID=UPI00351A579C
MAGPDIQIVLARACHIRTIARRMRKADREEVFAASGKSPAGALIYSLRKSAHAWTALVDGRPEVMFGVGDISVIGGVGAPWLLGTDAVETHYVAFLRRSVDFRDQLFRRYPIMRNFVDDRNKASKRWLQWLGARMTDPVEMGGHPFRLFELRSANV